MDRRLLGDDEVDRFVAVGDGDEAPADVEVEDVVVAGDAEGGELDRRRSSAPPSGPWACTVSIDTPAAAAILASVVRA